MVHYGDMWTDSGSDVKARIGVCRGPNSTYWVRGSQAMNLLYPLCHAGSSLICGKIQGHSPPRSSLPGSGFLFSSYSTLTVRALNRLQPLWHAAFSLICGKIQGEVGQVTTFELGGLPIS